MPRGKRPKPPVAKDRDLNLTHKERMIERRAKQNLGRPDIVQDAPRANVGRAHPHYGLHPVEHALKKG